MLQMKVQAETPEKNTKWMDIGNLQKNSSE